MLSRSDVGAALKELAGRHGLDSLELDERDTAVVEFSDDGAIVFEFSENEGTLTMWSPLCSLDVVETPEAEHRLLKGLLSLNFPASRLHGARVGFNADLDLVLLAKEASFPGSEPVALVGLAEKFAVDAESILKSLQDGTLLADDVPLQISAASNPDAFLRA